jgi:hypothetical protein
VRAFLPVVHTEDAPAALPLSRAWREPRTLLIGVLVLCFAFTEGTANDWLAVALVDGHGTSEAVGALGFACFVSSMTVCRAAAGSLLSRFGRPLVLRASARSASVGCCWWCFGPALPFGRRRAPCCGEPEPRSGFPVGMSAAADDPHGAAVRVSVVSSIGYTAVPGRAAAHRPAGRAERWGSCPRCWSRSWPRRRRRRRGAGSTSAPRRPQRSGPDHGCGGCPAACWLNWSRYQLR